MSAPWPLVPLGDVCSLVNRTREFSGEIPYYSTGGINHDGSEMAIDRMVTFADRPSRAGRTPLTGDVGFAKMKRTKKAILIDSELEKCIFSTGFCFLRTGELLNPRFLFYYLQSTRFILTKDELAGNGIMASIRDKSTLSILIPLPTLEEQQRIVGILDEAFEIIQHETVQIENKLVSAKRLFQSKLQAIFNARDDNWEDFTFDEIIQSKLVGLVRNNKSQSDEYPYRYVKMNNIGNDNSFNESNIVNVQATPSEVEKFSLRNGDFLFNTRNSYQLVGKICVFQSEGITPTLFNNNIMRIRFTNEINPSFVALAFSSKGIVDQLEKMKSGTTSVVGIYYKSLRALRMYIPSLSEQNAIVDSLDLLMSKTQSLKEIYQNNLDGYTELKQSILQEAFSGRLTGGRVV